MHRMRFVRGKPSDSPTTIRLKQRFPSNPDDPISTHVAARHGVADHRRPADIGPSRRSRRPQLARTIEKARVSHRATAAGRTPPPLATVKRMVALVNRSVAT